jgi:predicted amidohydrolase YtcJ
MTLAPGGGAVRTIVLHGGTMRTLDPARPVARSLVIEGETIAALDEQPAGAERIDLAGGCVLPGFTDAHVHFPTWALTRHELQLHGTRSRDEVLARVAAAAPRVAAGRWLRGFGWTADGWEPSRAALDAVTGDVPAALLAHDWHSLWLNSAALAHAGGDLEVPGGVVDLEAGVLREEAAWAFRDRFTLPSHAELVEATRAALPVAAARGVTAIHDKDGVIGSDVVFAELRERAHAYHSLHASGARLALGSDAPVEEMDPLTGLRDAVLRSWRPHEALGLQAALEALTVTPAWLSGDENRRGRLAPGMLADLVILDRDPFDGLANAQVVATMLAGTQTS